MSGPMTDREALAALLHDAWREGYTDGPASLEWIAAYLEWIAAYLAERGVTLTPSLDEGLLARAFQSWMGDDGKYSRPQARYVAAEYRRLAQEGETST